MAEMRYVITRHTIERFKERVGTRNLREAHDEIEQLVQGQKWTEKMPRWAVFRKERNTHLLGVVHATVWRTDHRLRNGWEREIKVAFPVVYRGGRYYLVTCLIKRGTRQRAPRQKVAA